MNAEDETDCERVIILAAGQGTRLRPYTDDRPKCLVEIGGRSLLDRQLDVLEATGLRDVIVVAGYRADLIPRDRIAVVRNTRYADTNMVWTLFCAQEHFTAPLIVAYGDIVYDYDVLKALRDSPADIAVVSDNNWRAYWETRNDDPLSDVETFVTAEGRITALGGRPETLDEVEGQFIGLMRFTETGVQQVLEAFRTMHAQDSEGSSRAHTAFMTDLLQEAIDLGFRVDAVETNGSWVELDTVQDLMSPITKRRLQAVAQSVQRVASPGPCWELD